MLPIGTKVVMSEVGKEEYRHYKSNPHNEVGVIHGYIDDDKFVYSVEWEGGGENSYRMEDLDPYRPFLPNTPLEDYL